MDIQNNEVVVHIASYHAKRDAGLNERNLGLGLRTSLGDEGWFATAGGYDNSLRKTSLYAGIGKTVYSSRFIDINIAGGLVTGYRAAPVVPFVLPEVKVKFGRGFSIGVEVIPPAPQVSAAVAFSVLKSF